MTSTELKRRRTTSIAGRNAGQQGFTLIETSIAMLVMMVAGLGVAALFTYSINYNSGGNDRAVAISIAQQQLEQLRSVPFGDPILDVTAATVLNPDTVSNGRTYRVTRTVTGANNNTSGNPTLKTITIQVTPLTSGFVSSSVRLRTIRSATTTGAN